MSSKPSDFIVGLVQMDIRVGDCDPNTTHAAELVAEAARCGARMVVLPELWASGYALDRAAELAGTLGEGASATMEQLAVENRVWLAGSILERRIGRSCVTVLAVARRTGKRICSARWMSLDI